MKKPKSQQPRPTSKPRPQIKELEHGRLGAVVGGCVDSNVPKLPDGCDP